MIVQLVIGILFSIIEEATTLIFFLCLFRYEVKEKIKEVILVSVLVAIFSRIIRMYLDLSYAVLLTMVVFYALFILIFRSRLLNGIIIISMAYIANMVITTIDYFIVTLMTDHLFSEVVSQILYQISIILANALLMLGAAWLVHKKQWGVSLVQDSFSKVGRQINILIACYSLVGMIIVVQTVTTLEVSYDNLYYNIWIILSMFSLFLLMFLLVRNIQVMQKQMKMEEERLYLENLHSYTEEIKQINRDFYLQTQTLRHMASCQNVHMLVQYLDHLLQERNFMQASIEIHEPMLAAFLGKERHVCQSYGVSLTVECIGHYFTPESISGYQLNRILNMIFDEIIAVLKDKPSADKFIHFQIHSVIGGTTTFTLKTKHVQAMPVDIVKQLKMNAGTLALQYDPDTSKSTIIVTFQGDAL